MRGALDLSPYAARNVSEDQETELWSRTRELGVLLTITAVAGDGRGFFATVAGHGRQATARHPRSAYLAALEALSHVQPAAAS